MQIVFTKQAQKDYDKLKSHKVLHKNVLMLLEIISNNPFQNPPPYKKLTGELQTAYSRRINQKHRLVYRVEGNEVFVISMWTHYENI